MKAATKYLVTVSFLTFVSLGFLASSFFYPRAFAHGSSMVPAIKDGDMLIMDFSSCYDEDLTGKIIAFEKEDMSITHRVVEDHAVFLITKGDNNLVADPWEVGRNEVEGVVVSVVPKFLAYLLFAGFMSIYFIGIGVIAVIKDEEN